jgi:hypothetical protein
MYNDSSNSNNVSSWANVRHWVPQGSVLGPQFSILYVNDLPKIIYKTSVPTNFDEGNSILFAYSNQIDFNKIFR